MSVVTEVWSDGSGVATGGPIGWACVIRALRDETGEVLKQIEVSGGEPWGTNNLAELTAVAMGLSSVVRQACVVVVSDSEYVLDGYRRGRVAHWKGNGWRTQDGGPVLYRDVWETIDIAVNFHQVEWRHVKGHLYRWVCDACGFVADNGRKRSCPQCAEQKVKTPLRKEAIWPLNERCDQLAGEARQEQLRLAAA